MAADSKVNILLVDDLPSNLLALEAVLEGLGQNLVKARSGTEALRCLLDDDFALILLDVQMPGLDGLETAALIRSRERSRHTPIIFLTGFERTEVQMFKGYSLGAVDYLVKPLVPEVLRSKVSVFVDLYQKTEQVKRQADLLRETQQREHERRLTEEKQRWELERLRKEAAREKGINEELARTVNERLRAEQSLQQSNERLRLLSETASSLLRDDEPQALIRSIYERLSAHLGLEVYLSHLVQPDDKALRLVAHGGIPDDLARDVEVVPFGRGITGSVAEQRRRFVAEAAAHSADPRVEVLRRLGIQAHACFPLLAQGRLIGTLSFGTRRRPAFDPDEVALMQTVCDHAAIALDRARLMRELQERADALAESDRRKDEFLAMLAHELRNPLAPVLNALHVLRLHKDPAATERVRSMAERQVRHMARLVDDLLDISRITRGKIQLRKETVELGAVISRAVECTRPLIESHRHRLEVTPLPEPVYVEADPTRLEQVLANLLNNAAKYTEAGGRIALSAERHDGQAVLRVRDTGVGIPPEMLPRIFELFTQVDRSLDRAQGGLGIGLTLVKNLVELHGGTVEAHSPGPGRGSEFVVRLPVLTRPVPEPEPAESEPEPVPVRCPAQPLRVLIVDDNQDSAASVAMLLELEGHQVTLAHDGAAAVEAARRGRPDVILLDIGLPGMDGYEVARRIRQLGMNDVLLVAMTGYGQAEDRRRSREAGFDRHLVKPVDPDDLQKLLRRAPAAALS